MHADGTSRPLGAAGRIARIFLDSKLTPLLIVAALLLGAFALAVTPREEEPQIQVPMVDLFVGLPGASPQEVERRVVAPLEKALYEIENVEYVYSTSESSGGLIIARFVVGSDPDRAVQRVQAKVAEITALLPPEAIEPRIVPRSIDDVPVVAYTLWARPDAAAPLDVGALRRVALELRQELARHPRVAQVTVLGDGRRALRIDLDREAMAAHGVSPLQVHQALAGLDWTLPAGRVASADRETTIEVDAAFTDAEDVASAVIATSGAGPIHLRDIARVVDGIDEPSAYVWMLAGTAGAERDLPTGLDAPALTLAVAKKPGTNAVDLVADLDRRLDDLAGRVVPAGVGITKTRDYGFTADEKSSELIEHLWGATFAVVLLMAFALGRREAVVVAVVVPTTLALTLASSYLFGYTLNRVTLFALIFAIGILVDDAIVVVENIHRHYRLDQRRGKFFDARESTVRATDEVGTPTILATFAVVAALLPLAFVSGLMGPYMQPIPVNASAAMVFSLLVAFVVSPWLTYRLFRRQTERSTTEEADANETPSATDDLDAAALESSEAPKGLLRLYARLMTPLLERAWRRWAVLAGVALLLVLSIGLVVVRAVTVKMLPFDNKSEVQVVLDMPEGGPLEQTAALARRLADAAGELPEVTDVQVYVGTSAPFNFNGLVRHYFLRSGPAVADLQVNLQPKHERERASHPFAGALREHLAPLVEGTGASLKITEVPPGPPVLSTLVLEVYGPDLEQRLGIAEQVREIFEHTPGVVDVDSFVEERAPKVELRVDRTKAARAGITPEAVARTLRLAVDGATVGRLRDASAREPVPLVLRLERAQRATVDELLDLRLHQGRGPGRGGMVALREVVEVVETTTEPAIYHKNLQPVTYVVAEVAGAEDSPIYGILAMRNEIAALDDPLGRPLPVLFAGMPGDAPSEEPASDYALKWDGEWQITHDVFLDMGIAFAVVLVLIYILVVGWFKSFVTPLIIMAPIPLTLVGILPAHALGGVFFTATSMIGFIALAGIIVRNSILLVDFIHLELERGTPLERAVLEAAIVRLRPIVLTGASLVVGGVVILLDPIFQGLAVSLIAGVVVATALTLIVIPLLYYSYLRTVGVDALRS
ncbi:MAG: efflux RND transporter permease subunit [Acidobacteriota bacterium]